MRRRFGNQSEKRNPVNYVKNLISTISTRITKKQDNPLLDSSLSGIFLTVVILGAYFAGRYKDPGDFKLILFIWPH